jgi:hypothetical protein
MALTDLQRDLCRLVARQRVASGESYVAGGVALNELLSSARVSDDIDLFHDSEAALDASWVADRELLRREGYGVDILRQRPGFVEASIRRGGDRVLMQWARDSAFRFFPLVEHPDLGLVLHPFDLATNKVLALVGRLEVRDWIDVLTCDARLQPLGYLAWAACGKDPGFSPASILSEAARSSRYSADEVAALAFVGDPPDIAALSRQWHSALSRAHEVVQTLPPAAAGRCVLSTDGSLFGGDQPALAAALARGAIRFHVGRLRGAYPTLV